MANQPVSDPGSPSRALPLPLVSGQCCYTLCLVQIEMLHRVTRSNTVNFMFVLEQMCLLPVKVTKCVCVCVNRKNERSDVV